MALSDVEIVITDQTRPLTQAGFGLPLVFGTELAVPYAEYTSVAAVAEDYDTTSDVYKAVAAIFAQEPRPQRVAAYSIARMEPEAGDLAAALNELVQTRNDWYQFVYAPREHEGLNDVQELAAWLGAAEKFAAFTNEPGSAADIVDEASAAAEQMQSSRVYYLAHTEPETFPDAALIGRLAPLQPGSATFKSKTLQGVPEAGFGTTQILDLHEAGVNTYVKKFGVLLTSEGFVTDRTYADIQLAKDWLKARLTERISRVLFINEKVPYDDTGIAQIVEPIRTTLQQAVGMRIIARDADGSGLFTVTSPRREDIDPNDRANRILPDIFWDAIIAGAVHQVRVSGVIRI